MKLKRNLFPVALLCLGLSASLQAATYYVAGNGDDNRSSSVAQNPSTPWKTIQKAANTMVAGDTVIVADGVYNEVVTTGADGSQNARITFQAQSKNTVVTSFIVNKEYTTITGFTITGETAGIDGSVFVTTGGNYLNVIDNVFQGSAVGVAQLYVYVYGQNVRNVFAEGNQFLNGWGHAVVLTSGGGHIISKNTFTSPNGYDAFRIGTSNVTITGNTFTHWDNVPLTSGNLKPGVFYYFDDISGSPDFSNVGAPVPHQAGELYAFKATGSTPNRWGNAIVSNANHADIIQAFQDGSVGTTPPDYPARDVVFEKNLVQDCTGTQFGNISDDNNFANIDRWTFRNNVIVRISNAMNLYAPGFTFYNNTFYQAAALSGWVVGWGVSNAGTARNLTVYNNIFAECGTPERTNQGWVEGDDAPNQVVDYNLVIGKGTGVSKDPSMWNRLGRNAHGLNGVDPLFVNPANGNFHLQANSPARNTGINLFQQFTSDRDGFARPASGGWSMGAYEYCEIGSCVQAPPLPPPPPGTPITPESNFTQFKNVFNPTREVVLTINHTALTNGTLTIYDRQGREIKTLTPSSPTQTTWDGRNSKGDLVAAGTYLVVMKQGNNVQKKKIVVVK